MDSKVFTGRKLIWNKIIIDFLRIDDRLYSINEIELIIKNKFCKNQKYLDLSDKEAYKLKIPGLIKKVRFSYFMNHIINKFVINDIDSNNIHFYNKLKKNSLDESQIMEILNLL